MRLLQENSSPKYTIFDETCDDVRFVIEPGNYDERLSLWYRGMIVTARSISEYKQLEAIPINVEKVIHDQSLSIYEIGAGLAMFLPSLSETYRHNCINIDPLPYKTVIDLLKAGLSITKNKDTRLNIYTLIKRAEIYSKPKMIRTIKMTLEELYSVRYSDHCKRADIVVDVNAATMYSPDRSIVELLEHHWLLNNDFTDIVWSPGTFFRRTKLKD